MSSEPTTYDFLSEEEYVFQSAAEAAAALADADAKWGENLEETGEFTPKGEVVQVRYADGMMEPDPQGGFWAVFETQCGEYLVNRVTRSWICVA